MGNRITKIYTRTGDNGDTGLADGTRLRKDHPRIIAMGDIDELNSAIGIVRCQPLPENIDHILLRIQHQLFEIGGELAIPGHECINNEHILQLERHIDQLNEPLPPLKEFILPGGSPASAHCHLARAICRRAERQLIALNQVEPCSEFSLHYLNRLSDLLFVMCRTINKATDYSDVYWQSKKLTQAD